MSKPWLHDPLKPHRDKYSAFARAYLWLADRTRWATEDPVSDIPRRFAAAAFWLATIALKPLLPRLKAFAAECIVAYLRDAESDAVGQLTTAEVANFRRLLDEQHGRRREQPTAALRPINFTAIRENSSWN